MMRRITATGGAATVALVVALGIAVPAAAAEHPDHTEHSTESTAPETHSDHGGHGSSGATTEDHSDHGSGSPTTEEESSHEGGHGVEADTVSDRTRVSVLGGFGAVNAAVIGSAFLLRRRDRRTGKQPPTGRGSRR